MAKSEDRIVRVERIAAGGAGIARLEGKSVFIELSAPGDKIRCGIVKEHKNWAEGEILEILEASPQRVAPQCPLYGRCGGCSLQHLNYEAQIEAKHAILRDAFIRIGGINPPEIRIRRSHPFEYRNRLQFHCLSGTEGELSTGLGFRERRSRRLVQVEDCPVADSGIRKALKEGKIIRPKKERFTVYSSKNTFLCEGTAERGRVSVLGKELAMDVKFFFQSNAAMLELLIEDLVAVASAAERDLPMADIYCGVGTFASFLGSEFASVDLVEENKAALALSLENVKGKKLNHYALTDTAWAKMMGTAKGHWGFMVLDPPREGFSGPLREWLMRNGPELTAYVSCDPATLARDSHFLLEGGYTLRELTMYDFYPQTAHIESLAIFEREKIEGIISIGAKNE